MSTLFFKSADGSTTSVELSETQALLIGRDPSCDIVFTHQSISRRQATIFFKEGSFYIEDQASKNGIYANGQQVRRHLLSDGDIIVLGLDREHPLRYSLQKLEYELTIFRSAYDFSKAALNNLKNLKTLIEINKAITSSLELEEVFELILSGVLEISSGMRAMILLRNKSGDMEVVYRKTLESSASHVPDQNLSSSIIKRVIETGKPVHINDIAIDAELQNQASIRALDLHSIVVIPLLYSQNYISQGSPGGALMGVIYVDNKAARRRFTEEDLDLLMAFSYQAAITVENAQLYRELQDNYVAIVTSLAEAVEVKDRYTRGHSELVSRYAVAIGERLGLAERELQDIIRGGILHDVGKIGIDETILNKNDKLTDEEFAILKLHTVYGARILEPVPHMSAVRDIVLHHHERMDGSGYPEGLTGDQISLATRVVSISDIYEALTSNRAYRKALAPKVVVKMLESEAGSKLDAELVGIFLSLYKESGYRKGMIKPRSDAGRSLCKNGSLETRTLVR